MFDIARVLAVWADRQDILADQGFNIRRGFTKGRPQESSAYKHGYCEIGLIGVLTVSFGNDYIRGNHFGEVVHDDSGEDFLQDELPFFSVEVDKPDGILQVSEGGFYAPTHLIPISD